MGSHVHSAELLRVTTYARGRFLSSDTVHDWVICKKVVRVSWYTFYAYAGQWFKLSKIIVLSAIGQLLNA